MVAEYKTDTKDWIWDLPKIRERMLEFQGVREYFGVSVLQACLQLSEMVVTSVKVVAGLQTGTCGCEDGACGAGLN